MHSLWKQALKIERLTSQHELLRIHLILSQFRLESLAMRWGHGSLKLSEILFPNTLHIDCPIFRHRVAILMIQPNLTALFSVPDQHAKESPAGSGEYEVSVAGLGLSDSAATYVSRGLACAPQVFSNLPSFYPHRMSTALSFLTQTISRPFSNIPWGN